MLIAQRYQVRALLGAGGMGGVYRALDRLTGQEVALKRVELGPDGRAGARRSTAEQTTSPSAARRTFRMALAHEFRTLATLRHPNIVSVLDYGFDAGHEPFFTMQLLSEPLDLLAAAAPLDLQGKLALLAQLLRALIYLHRRNIIHRDLKPRNVLVVPGPDEPLVKLVDFGIASSVGSAVELSGTPTYMAPELLTGQPPGPASDLYAVGVLLYQMLFGRQPFVAVTAPASDPESEADAERTRMAEETAEETVPSADWTPDSAALAAGGERELGERAGTERPLVELPPLGDKLGALLGSLLAVDPALRPQQAEAALAQVSDIVEELSGRPLPANTTETRESFLQAAVLVGREAELARLEAALADAMHGHGGLVLVGGESGIGKSRLLEELRTIALVRGVRALRGQAISNGGTAYQPFQEAIRGLALSAGFSDPDAAVLKDVVPELAAILGRALPDAPQLAAKEAQERVRRVLLQALTSSPEPLLLLLEDLHWADEESRELLKSLVAAAAASPLLIVASFRNDEVPNLPAQFPGATCITLRRLDEAAIRDLGRSMLGDPGGEAELVAFLRRETEGNALFIVEVLRALAEEAGGLDAIRDRDLPRHISSGGIQAVVQRRLGRAPAWTRRLLKLAAVAGRRIDRQLLASLEGQLEAWLQACTDAAILEVYESEWRFAHDKLREGLLGALSSEEERALHREVGEAIERVYPEGERPLAALAEHFAQGGDLTRAAAYASQAGSRALRNGALHEALALLERARVLQEQTQAAPLEHAKTLRRLSRTQLALGRIPESAGHVLEALRLLGQPVPKERLRLWLALGREVAIEVRHRIAGAPPETDPQRQAELRELLALIRGSNESLFMTNGQQEALLLVMLRALHAAEHIDDRPQQMNSLSRLAYAAYLAPLHGLGRFYLRRAARISGSAQPTRGESSYLAMSAYFAMAEGDWAGSLDCFTRWIESAARHGFAEQEALAHSSRAVARLLLGDLAGTLEDGDACLRLGQHMQNPIYIGSGIGWGAFVELRRGQIDAAYAHARAAMAQVVDIRDTLSKMSANGLLALAAALSGHLDEATEQIDATLGRMRRYLPAAPPYQLIYSSVLLAILELCGRTHSTPVRRAAEDRLRRALPLLLQFATRFPIGWPQLFLGVGRFLELRGLPRLALAVHAAGLPIARRYHMRYDEALLHVAAAEAGADFLSPAARAEHLAAATRILGELGAERERSAVLHGLSPAPRS